MGCNYIIRSIIMNKIKSLFVFILILSSVFISQAVYAVEKVEEDQGPSQEEISQFEKQFGAPPESFQAKEPEKPKFEQPGEVSQEVKQYATDQELVDIYCAMTKWKSGDFFSALDAINKYVAPAVEKVKELDISVSVPDTESLRSEGQSKINAICSAKTLAEAEVLARDFANWGQNETASKFDGLRSDLEAKIKAKGDELKIAIKKEVDSYVAEERPKIEKDISQKADEFVAAKTAELKAAKVKAAPDVSQVKAEITQKLQPVIAQKKAELQSKIQIKVDQVMAGKKEKFEAIGGLFSNIGENINSEVKANQGKYDQYKQEAFSLRKALIFKILDKKIEEGLKQLEAASAEIESAKKEDPSIKSVDEVKAEVQTDRKALESKLDAALEAGDEVAFQSALADFRTKWEGYREAMEKAASQSVSKACTVALAQFGSARNQIDPGLIQIQKLQSECANSTSDKCLKANELSSRFDTLTAKITDMKSEMVMAEEMCKTPESANRKNLIALMKKIQSDAEDLKIYGEALEAEKLKAIADSAKKACDQFLPQLNAAKTEIANNDLVVLKSKIDKCLGKSTEECRVVNQLIDKFNKLNTQIKDFSAGVAKAEEICQNPSEQNLEDLTGVLAPLREKGDDLRLLAKELQAEQAEKASKKALCRAIVPQLEGIKQEISIGLNELTAAPVSNETSSVNDQTEAILKKIANLNEACKNAGDETPDESFLADLESLKTDKDAIMKIIDELKTLKEKSYEMGKEITILKNSSWEGIMPSAKTLELFGRVDYSKAAGGQWLMEISINGQPITNALSNKSKTFKYSDGRAFPYYSSGGGSGQTSFTDGRSFTYYKTQDPAWMLFYAPDLDTDNTSSGGGYRVMTDMGQAHRYVWDISSLIGDSPTMTVKISNNGFVGSQTLPIIVKMYAK